MRWDGLFADLEAQAVALSVAERSAEIEDRTRSETGRLCLADRLRAGVGSDLRLTCLAGVSIMGQLRRVHPEWLLFDESAGREALVALATVMGVTGLGRLSAISGRESVIDARLGLRHALRTIARDRSALRMYLVDATVLDGTLDRVGADFMEIARHPAGEARRHGEVRDVVVVPIAALVAVRRDG